MYNFGELGFIKHKRHGFQPQPMCGNAPCPPGTNPAQWQQWQKFNEADRQRRKLERQQRRAKREASMTPAERQAREQRRFAKQAWRAAGGGYYPPGAPGPVVAKLPAPTPVTASTATPTPTPAPTPTPTPSPTPTPAPPLTVKAKIAARRAAIGQPGWQANCGGRSGQPIPSGFNPQKYVALNPDVAPLASRSKYGAAQHYSCMGWKEKRKFAGFGGRPGYLSGIFSNWDRG